MRLAFLALMLLVGGAAQAQVPTGNRLPYDTRPATRSANPDVTIEDKVGQQVPLDLTFRDENGEDVTVGQMIGGKPTILVLAYYRCPMNCTDVLNGLTDALKAFPPDFAVGQQFNVLTVSFDPKEQPGLAREKREWYLREYGRPGAEAGWHFLTGKKEPIGQLTDAVGFKFVYDKAFKEYDHPIGVVVLTPEGKVARYFYGVKYDGEYRVPGGSTTLRLSLVEASDGKVGSLVDKLILSCYRFDALEHRYSMTVLGAVRVGGILTVAGLVVAVVVFRVRERRRARAAGGPAEGLVAAGADRPAGGEA
ncbi:MAG: SCO family protein [Gemmataceae bacterium]|nr:SCO family protein [Gemmataceae bacterium]